MFARHADYRCPSPGRERHDLHLDRLPQQSEQGLARYAWRRRGDRVADRLAGAKQSWRGDAHQPEYRLDRLRGAQLCGWRITYGIVAKIKKTSTASMSCRPWKASRPPLRHHCKKFPTICVFRSPTRRARIPIRSPARRGRCSTSIRRSRTIRLATWSISHCAAWATHEGQSYVLDLRFAALPPELVKKIDDNLATIRLPKTDEPK